MKLSILYKMMGCDAFGPEHIWSPEILSPTFICDVTSIHVTSRSLRTHNKTHKYGVQYYNLQCYIDINECS